MKITLVREEKESGREAVKHLRGRCIIGTDKDRN